MSVGSDRSGVISKDLFKSLILPAVSLDDAVISPWMQATRHGRVNFAEDCCTSDNLLSGAVTSHGGRAVQYSHWNGFDLTTKAGTDKLKEDLLGKKPRVVRITPPCITQRTQQSPYQGGGRYGILHISSSVDLQLPVFGEDIVKYQIPRSQ